MLFQNFYILDLTIFVFTGLKVLSDLNILTESRQIIEFALIKKIMYSEYVLYLVIFPTILHIIHIVQFLHTVYLTVPDAVSLDDFPVSSLLKRYSSCAINLSGILLRFNMKSTSIPNVLNLLAISCQPEKLKDRPRQSPTHCY